MGRKGVQGVAVPPLKLMYQASSRFAWHTVSLQLLWVVAVLIIPDFWDSPLCLPWSSQPYLHGCFAQSDSPGLVLAPINVFLTLTLFPNFQTLASSRPLRPGSPPPKTLHCPPPLAPKSLGHSWAPALGQWHRPQSVSLSTCLPNSSPPEHPELCGMFLWASWWGGQEWKGATFPPRQAGITEPCAALVQELGLNKWQADASRSWSFLTWSLRPL